ncbi:MAG TPA: hypothetical protein VFH83_07855, partial [Spirochaetia bacterium]|nr:hypothetical protein [Spirochaetia bacterium]
MTQVRRALPWVASIAAHGLLLLIPIRIVWQPMIERRVEIDLALQAVSAPRGVAGPRVGPGKPTINATKSPPRTTTNTRPAAAAGSPQAVQPAAVPPSALRAPAPSG